VASSVASEHRELALDDRGERSVGVVLPWRGSRLEIDAIPHDLDALDAATRAERVRDEATLELSPALGRVDGIEDGLHELGFVDRRGHAGVRGDRGSLSIDVLDQRMKQRRFADPPGREQQHVLALGDARELL
jgi:hypothetical protein